MSDKQNPYEASETEQRSVPKEVDPIDRWLVWVVGAVVLVVLATIAIMVFTEIAYAWR